MRKWMIDHCWREEDVEHLEGIDYGYPKPAACAPGDYYRCAERIAGQGRIQTRCVARWHMCGG